MVKVFPAVGFFLIRFAMGTYIALIWLLKRTSEGSPGVGGVSVRRG
jgi:hypothetical protein